MKTFLILIALFSFSLKAQLFDMKAQAEISFEEFEMLVPKAAHIIMGEYHDDLVIQVGQKTIIESVVSKRTTDFTLSWEFLNFPDQSTIDQSLLSLKNKSLSDADFMKVFYPGGQYQNYLAPISTLKTYEGNLIGINAPRTWKRLITKDGLANLDPKYLPPNMELGTPNYEERFYAALGGGGHAPNETLVRYYEAQCYTDSVMAWQSEQNSSDLNFVMVGSFHSDYGDGMVEQLKKITNREVITIKVVNKNNYTEDQLTTLKSEHPKYGLIADYLYIAQ